MLPTNSGFGASEDLSATTSALFSSQSINSIDKTEQEFYLQVLE